MFAKSIFIGAVLSIATAVDAVTHVGRGTVYDAQTGSQGSCGGFIGNGEFAVALSDFWQQGQSPGPKCGRKIKVTNNGPLQDKSVGGKRKTVVVTVRDTCPGCGENDLDLTFGAWNALTNNHEPSVVSLSWNFCNENGQC